MRNIYVIIFILLFIEMNGQKSDTFTSLEYNENVSTQNDVTKINLFNLDFNSQTIPINLVYRHTGVMVNESPSSLGVGWELQNIGKITRTINDELDNKPSGWFNTLDENYATSAIMETVNCTVFPIGSTNITCPEVSGSYPGNDLSPDFFNFATSNGLNFDFLYKKSHSGSTVNPPIPVILSNFKDYEINTNFSNFYHDDGFNHTEYGDVVFDVVDTNGNKYDFINGLDNPDPNRSFNGDHRNDYYLSSITNPSSTNEVLNITYRPTLLEKKVYFSSGYSDCPGGLGSNCDVINNLYTNYFTISENRYDINQITTKNSIINFIYNGNYLIEIEIKDLFGNYISGYVLSYVSNPTNIFLQKIEKYNTTKTELQTLFQFDYYDANLGIDFSNSDRLCRDYFGYFNGNYIQTNLFPYQVSYQAGLLPAANLNPNLTFAQYYSLKKITNKFGGTKEFSYGLKTNVCGVCQGDVIYGGGLVMDHIITTSNNGNSQYIKYNYDDLDGNIVNMSFPKSHYTNFIDNYHLVWSSRIQLMNVQDRFDIQSQQVPIQRVGNFYKKITESIYNYPSMNLLSKTISEYEPNLEGIYLIPQLRKETFLNSASSIVKTNEYFYSNSIVETIQSASFRCDTRNLAPSIAAIKKLSSKVFVPIDVVRTNLIEKREILNSNSGSVTNEVYLSYADPNSNLIRSKIELSSTGVNNEERYYYPNDSQVSSEPNINVLQVFNRVGLPIKVETYAGTEKIFDQKTVFGLDATTNNLLLPKYIYAKKGEDFTGNVLEKKLTYNSYDIKGNATQYTTENGIPVSLIWGYGNTKLIAKVENLAYSSIPTILITNAQNASDVNNNETNLLVALDAIRNNAALANAYVTTFTYKPLVGTSTITDSKGDRILYSYDALNRLLWVKDKNGNILSENQYNYKP